MAMIDLDHAELSTLRQHAFNQLQLQRATRVSGAQLLSFWVNLYEKLVLASHEAVVGETVLPREAEPNAFTPSTTTMAAPAYATQVVEETPPPVVWNEGNPNLVDSDKAWSHPDSDPYKQQP